MKISKLFHWLYASVMMLPLFASIVFAIYMRNENSTRDISVDYDVNKVVDFNQYVQNGDFINESIWQKYLLDDNYIVENNKFIVNDFSLLSVSSQLYQVPFTHFNVGDVALIKIDFEFDNIYYANISLGGGSYINQSISNIHNEFRYTMVSNSNEFSIYLNGNANNTTTYLSVSNVQCFNLTQMFGVGNEPSIAQFNTWYTDVYYAYNTGTKQLLHNYSSETYNNTDVGSQLIYTLYNSTNNYFNVTNFLGLNNLYDWISINVFNGTPALAFSLFYLLLSYWLLVSIFWLVFDVVMYVPNLAHRWLDKGSLQ